jgi:enoyl-CoA hydratase/carnithine racemase
MTELQIDIRDHIMQVTLNRPDIHNAISHKSMIDEIIEMINLANQDRNIRALILTGAGKSFCAGGNVKDMRDKTDMFSGNIKSIEQAYKEGIQRIPLAFSTLEVPIIAAINGAAVGAGFDMTMMCDIRIGSESARFAESFVKLGIIPGDGGAWFLPRIIGQARASQMALTGTMIDAKTAFDWGIISEYLKPEDLLSRAWEIAKEIAKNPPLAVRQTKKLLRKSESLSLSDMLDLCAKTQAQLHQTNDHMKAVSALLDKRQVEYSGN